MGSPVGLWTQVSRDDLVKERAECTDICPDRAERSRGTMRTSHGGGPGGPCCCHPDPAVQIGSPAADRACTERKYLEVDGDIGCIRAYLSLSGPPPLRLPSM
jgi:hypothetical protein